jgi:hypothetical protein
MSLSSRGTASATAPFPTQLAALEIAADAANRYGAGRNRTSGLLFDRTAPYRGAQALPRSRLTRRHAPFRPERPTDPAEAGGVRRRPALLRALGSAEPPGSVQVAGSGYRIETVLKHDSWAATALYSGPGGERIICKFNRVQPAFGIPMAWLGRMLARREAAFLRRLASLELVPDDLGPVIADAQPIAGALARTYIDGEAFRDGTRVDAAFFAELRRLLDAIHASGIAYVDLHKRENIIVDRSGRPHLVDFQVSLGTGRRWPGNGRLAGLIVRKLQEMDDYHYRKHYARCLPEALTPAELQRYLEPPGFIRAHRRVAVPLRRLRRRLLVLLKVRDRSGQARSELEPEDALRPPRQPGV